MARFFRFIVVLLFALVMLPAGAWAHALAFSKAELRVAKAGEATLTLRLDLRRLLTGSEPGDLTEAQFEALFGAETAERAGLVCCRLAWLHRGQNLGPGQLRCQLQNKIERIGAQIRPAAHRYPGGVERKQVAGCLRL